MVFEIKTLLQNSEVNADTSILKESVKKSLNLKAVMIRNARTGTQTSANGIIQVLAVEEILNVCISMVFLLVEKLDKQVLLDPTNVKVVKIFGQIKLMCKNM